MLTADEQDALAANCGYCWAFPGKPCKTSKGRILPRPHRKRITRARRRGILGGVGKMLLESQKEK